jgi:hypothetical protein
VRDPVTLLPSSATGQAPALGGRSGRTATSRAGLSPGYRELLRRAKLTVLRAGESTLSMRRRIATLDPGGAIFGARRKGFTPIDSETIHITDAGSRRTSRLGWTNSPT